MPGDAGAHHVQIAT